MTAWLSCVDMGGKKVPAVWSEALKILQKNYANSLVISAFADVMQYSDYYSAWGKLLSCNVSYYLFVLFSENEIFSF